MNRLILVFIMLFSFNTYAQDAVIQQFLEQRKKMMEEIMNAFEDDEFFKDDFSDDGLFDSIRKHGFKGIRGFKSSGNNVKIEERIEKDGSISVVITPNNKNIKLDIKTQNNKIEIKSEVIENIENKNKSGSSSSYSKSSYTRTISIPNGFTAKDPYQESKSIIISLVPKNKNQFKPISNGRIPIKKMLGDEAI